MKLEMEQSGDVKRIFDMVVEEYPEHFKFLTENAMFQFTTRADPKYDDDGREIAASAQKLSNRERDLYGSDFEICIYEEYWSMLTDEQKKRLIFHELLHCEVAADEDDDTYPAYDKDDRVVIYCVPHDLIIKTFKEEIIEFGLEGDDLKVAEFLHNQYEEYLQSKKRNKR